MKAFSEDEKLVSKQLEEEPESTLGIRVENLTPEMAQRFNITETSGVIVADVKSDSKGAEAGVMVGDIITAGLDAGANNIYGVNFILSDPQSVIDQARTAAIADARARAEAMAAGFGVQLGKIVSISEGINGVPSPVYNAAVGKGDGVGGGGTGVTVSPGQTTVNVQVYVTYAIAQ